MSEAYAEEVFNTLLAANVTDKEARKQHVKTVKFNKARRDTAVANGKCPRCGGDLVLRKGKYGHFYGCSNYPTCKFMSWDMPLDEYCPNCGKFLFLSKDGKTKKCSDKDCGYTESVGKKEKPKKQ
ncbi:MAG: topoisomerase DNA-binding C4 zinc finger domain-containing protein [Clostridia bacterium]|nr:topoisomerase DNA-binding C4 zinc finger domain-containing protein [Clostridia bacterium]